MMKVLLQLNVLLALAGASVALSATVLARGALNPAAAFVVFSLVFAIYNLDRLADDSPAEGRSTPLRAKTVRTYRTVLRWLVPILLVAAITVALFHGLRSLAWSSVFPAAGIAYVLPLLPFGRVRRLKDVPYLKAIYVPATWTSLLWTGLAFSELPTDRTVLCFAGFFFARLFISGSLGDIRDIADDAEANIQTVAAKLGVTGTHRLLHGVHLLSVAHLCVGVFAGWMPAVATILLFPTAFAIGLHQLYRRYPAKHEIIFELYDLEFASYTPLLLLAGWLGGS